MISFQKKKYKLLMADPPWKYKDKSLSHGGGAESHYPTLSTKEICEIQPPSDKDSILLLWCSYPMLPDGLQVMEAWGFKFKTVAYTWVKLNKDSTIYMGMGKYTRANAEICLLGRKGKGLQRKNCSIYNTQAHIRTSHSSKPEQFKSDSIKLFGDVLRIELFTRKSTKGWDSWGSQLHK